MRIFDVEGIGPVYAALLRAAGVDTTGELLRAAGVDTTGELLEAGASLSGREKLAKATGLITGRLLEWVNHADLMRLDGVGRAGEGAAEGGHALGRPGSARFSCSPSAARVSCSDQPPASAARRANGSAPRRFGRAMGQSLPGGPSLRME